MSYYLNPNSNTYTANTQISEVKYKQGQHDTPKLTKTWSNIVLCFFMNNLYIYFRGKIQGKFIPVIKHHALKAYRGVEIELLSS
jgi:hypothetical protein